MKLLKKRDRKRGFTMVELMVVVAILAALVLLVAPKVMGNSEKARIRTFESNYRTLVSEITVAGLEKKSGEDIPKTLSDKYADKPKTATYTISGKYGETEDGKLVAKYGEYELTYSVKDGKTEAKKQPDGASF